MGFGILTGEGSGCDDYPFAVVPSFSLVLMSFPRFLSQFLRSIPVMIPLRSLVGWFLCIRNFLLS